MTVIDFNKMQPEMLAEIDPATVTDSLSGANPGSLTENAKRCLQYGLEYWTVSALSRPNDIHTVLLLDRLCVLVARYFPETVPAMKVIRNQLEVKRQDIKRKGVPPPRLSSVMLSVFENVDAEISLDEVVARVKEHSWCGRSLSDFPRDRVYTTLCLMEVWGLVRVRRREDLSLVFSATSKGEIHEY